MAISLKTEMKNKLKRKMIINVILVCIFTISIPALLILYSLQAKRYTDLEKNIRDLEQKQLQLIEENKKIVSEISVLSSSDRIEQYAVEELGMHKAESEEIVRVEMTGEKK